MACPICGAPETTVRGMRCVPKGYDRYKKCSACGVLFNLNRVDKIVMSETEATIARRKAAEQARMKYYKSRIRFIQSELRKSFPGVRNMRLLSIGAGAGGILRAAEGAVWDLVAIESSPELCEEIRSGLPRARVVQGQFPDVSPPDLRGMCHVATVLELLEKNPDPTRFLGGVCDLLHRRGLCLVQTPNARSIAWHIYGERWLHFRPERSLFLFDPGSLASLAERTGFKVRLMVSASGTGAERGVARAVARVRESFLRLLTWGSSLLAVLEKK